MGQVFDQQILSLAGSELLVKYWKDLPFPAAGSCAASGPLPWHFWRGEKDRQVARSQLSEAMPTENFSSLECFETAEKAQKEQQAGEDYNEPAEPKILWYVSSIGQQTQKAPQVITGNQAK